MNRPDCPSCDPDTRTSILDTIYDWTSRPKASPTCVLVGRAGSGKSAIARSVSENLANHQKLAASFYFNRQEIACSSKDLLVTTIAYQLATSVRGLKSPISDVITKDPTILKANFATQLRALLVEPLQSLPVVEYGPSMVIIIDGLDECKDYADVVHLITTLTDSESTLHFPLRFLVTTRPEPSIPISFEQPERPVTLNFCLDDFDADADIHLFLERKLRYIALEHPNMSDVPLPWPSNEELVSLVAKSEHLFIYASTVVKFVADDDAFPQQRLKTILASDFAPDDDWIPYDSDEKETGDMSEYSQFIPEEPPEPVSMSIDLFVLDDLVDPIPEHGPNSCQLSLDLYPLDDLLSTVPDVAPQALDLKIDLSD